MTLRTAPEARPAPQRRPGVREGSSWRVPIARMVLSTVPVVAGSLRLLEVAGGPRLLPANPRMAVSIVLGFTAIRRRDIAAHRAWMVRAYTSISAWWVANAAVAEWVVRRPARTARTARTRAESAGAR